MAIAIDPVCGMEVETEGAELTAVHDGRTYYFCGRGCLLDFRDDPDRYVGQVEDSVGRAGLGPDAAGSSPSTAGPDRAG